MGKFLIRGQGLAGTCLAWHLWWKKADFTICDREQEVGSSQVAAGFLNPVTGRNFEPSWRIEEFLPEANIFYRDVSQVLKMPLFHSIKSARLFANERDVKKFAKKRDALSSWIAGDISQQTNEIKAPHGGVVFHKGGWLDCKKFIQSSQDFFRAHHRWQAPTSEAEIIIEATGAAGLREGPFSFLPSRPMKGEILTVKMEELSTEMAQVRNGWLLPIENGKFRVGANYDGENLDENPTSEGRRYGEKVISSFTDISYKILDHQAGIRPIIRRSQPVIGSHPTQKNLWVFNGLGSKGSLYAPGVAKRLTQALLEGSEIEQSLSLQHFLETI